MQVRCRSLYFLVGLSLLSLAGCYSYSPYGYGYHAGPQFYPPGGALPPAGSPQMGPPQMGPPQQVPQSSYFPQSGQQLGANAAPQWQQPKQAEALPNSPSKPSGFGGATGSSEQPAKSRPVPQPRDPGDAGSEARPLPEEGFLQESEPFGANDTTGVELQGIDDGMTNANGMNSSAGLVGQLTIDETEFGDAPSNARFQTPVSFHPTGASDASIRQTGATERPNPYKYDRKGYAWLRGVVDYDESDKAWHLIYSLNPDTSDEYGGDITLVDSPDLNTLRNEDVVYVEGRIDESKRDRLGKPCYRVDRCMPLVPDTTP